MKKLRLISLMMAAGLLGTAAHAGYGLFNDGLRIDGFGTVGAFQADNDEVKVKADSRQKLGSQNNLRFDGDTLLAAQATVNPAGPLKGVWQMVSHRKVDGTGDDGNWRPLTEWAYLGWDVTPTINWKVGRVVAPLFLMSDTRNLGYAQTSVRPPLTMYQLNPITNLDGTTAAWDHKVGAMALNVLGMYGKTAVDVPTGNIDVHRVYGGAFKAAQGGWTGRIAYAHFEADVTVRDATLNSLLTTLQTLAPDVAATRTPTQGIQIDMFTCALQYEHDHYMLQAEHVHRFGNSMLTPDVTGWYVQGARRMGEVTPYVRWGQMRNTESSPNVNGLGPLAGLRLDEKRLFGRGDRNELALGARWDLAPKLALKFEYAMIKVLHPLDGSHSASIYYPTPSQASAFNGEHGRVNQLTLNLDFIF